MDAVQCAGVWYAAVLLCVWRPPSVNVVAYKDITTAGSRKAVRVYNILQILHAPVQVAYNRHWARSCRRRHHHHIGTFAHLTTGCCEHLCAWSALQYLQTEQRTLLIVCSDRAVSPAACARHASKMLRALLLCWSGACLGLVRGDRSSFTKRAARAAISWAVFSLFCSSSSSVWLNSCHSGESKQLGAARVAGKSSLQSPVIGPEVAPEGLSQQQPLLGLLELLLLLPIRALRLTETLLSEIKE